MAISLVQLTHFAAVAKAGSFSGAARMLGIAQPAVSQSIAALERELDVQLLNRTSRTCRLTPLGEEFLIDAERIVKDLDTAVQRTRRSSGRNRQRLVLGMTGGLSSVLTERLLRDAPRHAPGVDLVIMEGSVGRLRELLLEGRMDCALIYNILDTDPQLKTRFVAYEPMHLIAHPEVMARHLRPGPLDLAQVARFPLFLPSVFREAGAGQLLVRAAQRHGIRLDIRYELQSTTIVRRLLMQDMLATVIGPGSVIDDVASGALQARVVEMPEFARTVGLAMLSSRPYGPPESALLRQIQQIASDFLIPCGVWRTEPSNFASPDYDLFRQLRS